MSTQVRNLPREALFASVVPAGTLAFAVSLVGLEGALGDRLLSWAALLTLTVLAGLFPVRIPGTRSVISVTDVFIFTSVLFFGVFPSVILAGVDALISTRRMTRKVSSTLYSFAVMSLSVLLAGLVFETLVGRVTPAADVTLTQLLLPLTAMTLIHYLVDSGLVAAITAFSHRKPVLRTWVDNFLWSSVSFFSGASAAALIYMLVRRHGLVTFVVALPILLITYYTYKIYMEKVEDKNKHIREMSEVYLSTVEALTMAIDAKDEITYGHVRRVRVYAIGLGILAGLDDEQQEGIKAAALLHDVGKLAIPEHILNKPGKLSPSEFEKMKSHTIIGAEILSNVKFPYPVIPFVRHHHEWWDGNGYPDGLAGEQIELGSRVLAIADCYDAMRSPRPYHTAMNRAEAAAYMLEGRGTHFDPRLIDLFLANVERLADEAEAVEVGQLPGSTAASSERRRVEDSSLVLESISSAQRETRLLTEMARAVGTSLSLPETMRNVLETLVDFVPYTSAVIFLKEESLGLARARSVGGRNEGTLLGMSVALGKGATGWAIMHNRTLHNFDPALELAGVTSIEAGTYRCGATFPLAVSERVLGAITLYSENANQYTTEHERVMEIVTHQASMALLNAVMHEQAQATALTDPLTGIPNQRYLRQIVQERLRHQTGPIHLLLMDLDGFKAVNDRHGHPTGDRVLKETVGLLGGVLRADDVLIRVGGDEFVVLSSTDPEVGLGRRLSEVLDEHDFKLRDAGGTSLHLGLSVGSATLPDDGTDLETVLAVADRRMYADKARRRRLREQVLAGAPAEPDLVTVH